MFRTSCVLLTVNKLYTGLVSKEGKDVVFRLLTYLLDTECRK